MNNQIDLTKGSVFKNLLLFSIPYLISCFLQTFYGLADLFIAGQFNGAATITAVSVGSQIMHMVTVIIVGFAAGTTVLVSRFVGASDERSVSRVIGNSIGMFLIIAGTMTLGCITFLSNIIQVLAVPTEAITETTAYLFVCFLGIIFITFYNLICGVFRGLGDSKTPMYFVAIAGVINIVLDYILIGIFHKGALGAAIATVFSQAVSVVLSLVYMRKIQAFSLKLEDLKFKGETVKSMLTIGFPIALQDGFIQISFLIITIIANKRGVEVAAAVGIVEKLISFMFLVPSAMLSAVATITSANIGSNTPKRGETTLKYAVSICLFTGAIFTIICNIIPEQILSLFAHEEENVIILGAQYLRTYVFDCMAAGIHFCFSGYFTAYKKSYISFLHNVISILTVRIPGAALASLLFPATLYAMGSAAPLGSLLSAIICIVAFVILKKKKLL